jgi:transcriptional regulator with XRE-family HTH domain
METAEGSKLLRQYLDFTKLSESDFAQQANVSPNTLAHILSGQTTPQDKTRTRIEVASGGAVPCGSWPNRNRKNGRDRFVAHASVLIGQYVDNVASAEALAEDCEVSVEAVEGWRSGDRTPSHTIRWKISDVTNGYVPESSWQRPAPMKPKEKQATTMTSDQLIAKAWQLYCHMVAVEPFDADPEQAFRMTERFFKVASKRDRPDIDVDMMVLVQNAYRTLKNGQRVVAINAVREYLQCDTAVAQDLVLSIQQGRPLGRLIAELAMRYPVASPVQQQ